MLSFSGLILNDRIEDVLGEGEFCSLTIKVALFSESNPGGGLMPGGGRTVLLDLLEDGIGEQTEAAGTCVAIPSDARDGKLMG
mmetsp:Transcript_2531/g.2402  ORF Transcript_2531/g.2402 Transcript_2531/m.2402 type:complete len:83 (+) Transcript_2531:234-482(+)